MRERLHGAIGLRPHSLKANGSFYFLQWWHPNFATSTLVLQIHVREGTDKDQTERQPTRSHLEVRFVKCFAYFW